MVLLCRCFGDGGVTWASRRRTAAFVVVGIRSAGNDFELDILGGRSVWIEEARSAFRAEAAALDAATGHLLELARSCEDDCRTGY